MPYCAALALFDCPPYSHSSLVTRFTVGLGARVLLALGAAFAALSCASGDRNEQELGLVRAPISGGQPDSADSNVFLLVSQRGSVGVALCSASLIAPNLLLTARHCVSDVTDERVTCGKTQVSVPLPANTLFAGNAPSINAVNMPYRASAVSVPSEGSDICGYDVALITLTTNVPASAATPIVPRIDREVTHGELYSAIGYGQDSAGDAGVAGLRRARAGLAVSCVPGKCGQGVESSEFVGEVGICSGDSGGPALDAAGKLVGVVSRSGSDCAHPVYASAASWKNWITSIAAQAAAAGNYPAPFWVTSGLSEPGGGLGAAGAGSIPSAAGASGALPGTQGARCAGPEQCAAAFACYSPTSSPTDASCSAFCSKQSDCAAQTECASAVGVCVSKPSQGPDTSSCAVRAAGARERAPLTAFLLLATVLISEARRRRRASSSKRAC